MGSGGQISVMGPGRQPGCRLSTDQGAIRTHYTTHPFSLIVISSCYTFSSFLPLLRWRKKCRRTCGGERMREKEKDREREREGGGGGGSARLTSETTLFASCKMCFGTREINIWVILCHDALYRLSTDSAFYKEVCR